MNLHFSWDEVEKLIEEVRAATKAEKHYGKVVGKGFWLVGDQGVYLMANTKDGPREKSRKKGESCFVVYAKECDPTKLEFDEWWENKRASFGGDDGAEFIGLKTIERLASEKGSGNSKPQFLVINISPDNFRLGIKWHKPVVKPAVANPKL